MIEVRTQAEMDRALAKAKRGDLIVCVGDGYFQVSSGSATVYASDSATVYASGSATVYAYGSATVYASGSATVYASNYVAVHKHHPTVTVSGGVIIEPPTITTIEQWCDYHGVTITDGQVILYKAVDDQYRANHNGFEYKPGTAPEAPDWDPIPECGGGLHFSPSPHHALGFNYAATRFVACPVLVSELVVHPNGQYLTKVKGPRVAAPCWEVDIHGRRVAGADLDDHTEGSVR
jgi:hypothetical protein